MPSKIDSSGKSSFDRLAAINRAITTSLNFNEALRLIVNNATGLFSADNALLLLAEDDGVLRVRAAYVDSEITSQFAGPMEESVIRDLARQLKLDPSRELVTVPIVAQGSLNGFLAIVRDSKLSAEEQWQLSALADRAAIALNNARLHEFQTEKPFASATSRRRRCASRAGRSTTFSRALLICIISRSRMAVH